MSNTPKPKKIPDLEFFFGSNPMLPGQALLEVRQSKTGALVMKQVFTVEEWNEIDRSMRNCLASVPPILSTNGHAPHGG